MGSRPRRHALRQIGFGSELRHSEDLWVAPLLSITPLLHEFGIDERAVLRRAGIHPDMLGDPLNRLPFGTASLLVHECARATGCAHFGLLLGQRSGAAAVGISGELARHSATVGAGLRVLIAHLQLHDRGAVLALNTEHAGHAELAYVIHHRGATGAAQVSDAALAIGLAIMRNLCGPQWLPSEVTLSRERPPNVAPYRSCFGAPVRFDAARSALIFPAHCLEQPVAGANPSELARLSKLAAELEAARTVTMAEKVVRALSQVVVAIRPSGNRVSRAVGMSTRSMNRRLAAEGTSYRELLEDVRFALASQLLEESRMPVGEIAATLHYSAPAAFSRAFKAWSGERPLQRRARARQAGRRTRRPMQAT